MTIKTACFFTYRHRPDKDYRIFIGDLYDNLSGKISLWFTQQGVFRDTERMQSGDFLEPSITRDPFESASKVKLVAQLLRATPPAGDSISITATRVNYKMTLDYILASRAQANAAFGASSRAAVFPLTSGKK
jgi:hypothetical protein